MKLYALTKSLNSRKVLALIHHLDLPVEIDAMTVEQVQSDAYGEINPNRLAPTLVDGDFVLWESNSVMRYLCLAYGQNSPIYPQAPQQRAAVDRWLDWTLSTLQPVGRPVFWALVRTPPEKRDMVQVQKDADAEAMQWRIVDTWLANRRFMEGDAFTIADVALGAFARRWFGVEGIAKPQLENLERWFALITTRPGYIRFIAPPMT